MIYYLNWFKFGRIICSHVGRYLILLLCDIVSLSYRYLKLSSLGFAKKTHNLEQKLLKSINLIKLNHLFILLLSYCIIWSECQIIVNLYMMIIIVYYDFNIINK